MGLNPSIMPSYKQQVRWVDRTGQDTNAHFPLSRFWERTLLNRQHLCRLTILIKLNSFHLSTLLSHLSGMCEYILKVTLRCKHSAKVTHISLPNISRYSCIGLTGITVHQSLSFARLFPYIPYLPSSISSV